VSHTALTTAHCGFEAARHLGSLRALMGHGFSAQVCAALPSAWAPYPGAEVHSLLSHLRACIEPLHQRLLNDVLDQPDDETLAQWILSRLALPVSARVSVQRNATQGVHLLPDINGVAQSQHWRRYAFQSAHQLPHVPAGHKCGRLHGHSFAAIVQAAQPTEEIDEAWAPLHMALNYRCLNDVQGLENPTSEHLALWLWDRLRSRLQQLRGVTVFETASCGAHVNSQGLRIWKDFSFDSATRLRHAPASSERAGLHGYTYTLRLHLEAPLDPHRGWAVDFGDVKNHFKPVFDALDHQRLDELPGLDDGDCASLARWIQHQAAPLLPSLTRVDVYELPGCGSVWLPPGLEAPILPGPTY
jgi:6-pyruvoyltetrahydropterin/6-carboxytetrahydropterin synthase